MSWPPPLVSSSCNDGMTTLVAGWTGMGEHHHSCMELDGSWDLTITEHTHIYTHHIISNYKKRRYSVV